MGDEMITPSGPVWRKEMHKSIVVVVHSFGGLCEKLMHATIVL